MLSIDLRPGPTHAASRAARAFALFALLAGCSSDSAAFTPTPEPASAGGEVPAASPPDSAPAAAGAAGPSGPPAESASTASAPADAHPPAATVPAEGPAAPTASAGAQPLAATTPAESPAAPAPSAPAPAAKPTAAATGSATSPKAGPRATAAASADTLATSPKPGAQPAPRTQPPSAASAAPPAPSAPAAQPAPPVAHVVVELRGLKNDSGKIQAALFRTEAGFPEDPNKAAVRKIAKISGRKVDLAFDVAPPGTFAVLVHHDENGDSKMQRGVFGQPAEGWGATRDPAANFGPPSFDDAKLTINAGETKRVVIKLRY